MIRQPFFPTLLDEPPLADRVRIGPEREGDDVGIETVNDGPRLARRAGMRLLDRNRGSRLGPVPGDELRVEVTPKLARGS